MTLLKHIGVLAVLMAICVTGQAADKPNIILILADDYGYGDVGCYGSDRFKTPALDDLAARGMRFTDFHSNGSVCSPTRAALLTGRYQQRTGVTGVVTAARHRHTGLALEELTFAEVLKGAGYATGMFGKWHLGYKPEFNPVHQGFDEFIGYVSGNIDFHNHLDQTGAEDWWKQDKRVPEEGYTTDLITKHGVDFIKRHTESPFLLYLPHESPHYPYQGRKSPPKYVLGKGRDPKKDKPDLAIYKEMIEVMDEGIGRIVDAVEEAGLTENTFIFFFADNGPAGPGSAGKLRGQKGQIYEGGHRVPAIACWPGNIKAGSVSDALAMGADLLPTMAALAGAELPHDRVIDGINLLPHLTHQKPLEMRPMFWGMKRGLAVRKGPYKLVMDPAFTSGELYNLQTDISESRNLASDKPELFHALKKVLETWNSEVSEGVDPRS